MKISTYIQLAILIAVACSALSCSTDENKIATQQGYLSLSANIDGSFAMNDGTTLALDANQVPETNDFSLTLSTIDKQYSHTWLSFDNFPTSESYMVGEYSAELQSDSKNSGPAFAGSETLYIKAGERTVTEVSCCPSDALMAFRIAQNSSDYSLEGITVHSYGGRYADAADNGYTFFDAGEAQIYASISDRQQRTLRLAMPYKSTISAAHGEYVNVALNGNSLSLNDTSYSIDHSIFDCAAPSISPVGFTPDDVVDISEGITLSQPLKMLGEAAREIVSARLTVQSAILNIVGAPSEIDLMQLSADDISYLESVGLKYTVSADKKQIELDYTTALENMASYTSSISHFTLMLEDAAGVCSDALTLNVNTKTLQLTIESITPAMMGVNKATMQLYAGGLQIERPDLSIYAVSSTGELTECTVTDWKTVDQYVEVEFEVPDGSSTVDVDVYYLGLKRLSTQVTRTSPIFNIDVDPYATNAALKIDAASDDILKAVLKYATFKLNGTTVVVSDEYEAQDVVLLTNLQPATQYSVSVSVADGAPVTARFTTESDLQVPEGDFEDWDPLFKYDHLPMGGKYSATELSIVNRQNFTNIDVKWPKKYWASINDKTFNKKSTNHNTWYMQPSSVIIYEPQSGYKAICITSVGWDHNGEKIADYVQKHGESLPYSNVVPNVSHRSAGRLFLGSYSYNFTTGEETFNEGYDFTSRPSSLNGFYKYTTDDSYRTDHGYVEIEIINKTNGVETVIASGSAEFAAATDYKSFNVPLTYKYYNLKATQLRIMFASTTKIGSQEYEDANVPLTAHPEKGAMTGSSLWIDNLSFTY